METGTTQRDTISYITYTTSASMKYAHMTSACPDCLASVMENNVVLLDIGFSELEQRFETEK
ncbi:MAG: hypothetical protein ABSE00_03265 [Chitinispirillaceae bacterium]|jgi:hypothetical protein